jgi:signal transduction histidine kinase
MALGHVMRRKAGHIAAIVLSALVVVLLLYLGDLPWLSPPWPSPDVLAGQAYNELCLLLFTGPVVYAAIVFRVRGGVILSLAVSAAVLPHALLFSPYPDPLFRLATFLIVTVLLAGFIGGQLSSNERLQREHARLGHFLSETMGAQEKERRYLAHELHDESLQALVDMSHSIDELLESGDGPAMKNKLRQLRRDADAIVEGTRRFIRGLRPPLLEEMGLAAALGWLAEELADECHIEVSTSLEDEVPGLSEPMELSLFRIAQEALNNVRKHSQATEVQVSLTTGRGKVQLRIADNGVGFAIPASDSLASQGKFGLIGMAERARLAGGSLHVESAAGKGTIIIAEMPVLGGG